jgi:FkbM family methyltransferase
VIKSLYKSFLMLPGFRGKARLDGSLKRLLFSAEPSTLDHGIVMCLDPLEWTQATLLECGAIEPLTMKLFGSVLEPGDAYVDVGAHVGFHTLVARWRIGPNGRVVAVEPQPYNCERILQNWELNGFSNLELYMAIAGDARGVVRLSNQASTDKARLSLVLKGVNDLPQHFHVPMMRLDDILERERISKVHLVKIDAEGFEAQVLAGMETSLEVTQNLVLELLTDEESGSSAGAELVERLRKWGFALKTVTGLNLQSLSNIPENNIWATRWSAERIDGVVAALNGNRKRT